MPRTAAGMVAHRTFSERRGQTDADTAWDEAIAAAIASVERGSRTTPTELQDLITRVTAEFTDDRERNLVITHLEEALLRLPRCTARSVAPVRR